MELLSSSIKKTYIVSKESFSYISGNGNPEKNFLHFIKRKLFLYFRKRKPRKKIPYISGNGTFLYFRNKLARSENKKFLIFSNISAKEKSFLYFSL